MLLPGPIAGFLVEQHAATKTAIPSIKLRRRTAAPKAQSLCGLCLRATITAGIGGRRNGLRGVSLRSSNLEPFMSALGQKQTLEHVRAMSALPPKADIATGPPNVRFTPQKRTLIRGAIHLQ